MRNFITGANKTGYHYKNCNISDMNITEYADVRNICEGDVCPKCGKPIRLCRGVEVGHIFKLGTKYTVALGCNFTDEQGVEKPMIMGCYGIGLGRTLASIIEQNYDDHGIIWPMEVAPYKVMVLPTMSDDPEIFGMAVKLHDMLVEKGIETIIDDRNERPGVKFNDCDLLGIPVRITVGRKAKDGIVEFKERRNKEVIEMTLQEAYEKTLTLI
jgi:prolyl-tRNA synthetase